ncbi:Vacuolar protein sorting-associated protein 11 [Cichlidogyrus casuarinus]|uniref:Vacuolar protein sorting-associated protein 11 n=1 Tax=Cichlidogyrus casuarinus TaxID=1844966 RepID=A0ABD2Q201_9PLAT
MSFSRRFGFFEKLPFLDKSNNDRFPVIQRLVPTSLTSSYGKIWLGDGDGNVYRCDRSLKVDSFFAHPMPILFIRQTILEILITIASKENPIENQMKLWNVKKWPNHLSAPICIRTININPANVPVSVLTAFDISSDFKCFVFGHSNGLVQLIKGDLMKEKASRRFTLKQMDSPVSFIGTSVQTEQSKPSVHIKMPILKRDKSSDKQTEYIFYLVSQSSIYAVKFFKDEVEREYKLEDFGCFPGEAAMFESNSDNLDLAVAYQDAIFFYNCDGRGPCIANSGRKYLIRFFRNYLVLVKSNKSSKEMGERRVAYEPNASTIVQIIDYQNKYIAAEFEMPFVFQVFSEWQGLFVMLTEPENEMEIYSLLEKDTSAKLEILFSKQYYQLAEELAKSQNFTQEELAQIYKHSAEYLFERKDYDAAATEYTKTIGNLEPSYVIQKFLDCNQIEPMTFYLEQVIRDKHSCTGHHVLLLVNCFTRIGDIDRLAKFVKNFQTSEQSLNNFDISSAIRVLRQTGYPRQALDLALAASQMEDASLECICAHGHMLMSELPNETGHFLEMLVSNPDASKIDVHHFLKIFVDNRKGLFAFLERYISVSQNFFPKMAPTDLVQPFASDKRNKAAPVGSSV